MTQGSFESPFQCLRLTNTFLYRCFLCRAASSESRRFIWGFPVSGLGVGRCLLINLTPGVWRYRLSRTDLSCQGRQPQQKKKKKKKSQGLSVFDSNINSTLLWITETGVPLGPFYWRQHPQPALQIQHLEGKLVWGRRSPRLLNGERKNEAPYR